MDPISILIAVAVIAFFVWLCILVPMNMAHNRGRSGLVWLIVSLFVSPIVAILLLYALGETEMKPV